MSPAMRALLDSGCWIARLSGTTDPQGIEELQAEVAKMRAALTAVRLEHPDYTAPSIEGTLAAATLREFWVTISYVDRVTYSHTRAVMARDADHAASLVKELNEAGVLPWGDPDSTDTEPYHFEVSGDGTGTVSWQED